jgi:site-specific DNA-adenine methylase
MKLTSATTITLMKHHWVKLPPRWANGKNKAIPAMVGSMKPNIRSTIAIFVGRGTFVAALFPA